ncbi:MAG: DUF2237 domain-containing protein [Chloracidobacterium sp.]|nr:DUF2237 domain-containing protein [Chloracidobacterium sp.]
MSYTNGNGNGNGNGHAPKPKNVLGGVLESCCTDPMTGFYRDGYCRTGVDDTGRHTVCIEATTEFLAFQKQRVMTFRLRCRNIGFRHCCGRQWCLCMLRWREALNAGMAPRVYLRATHEAALTVVSLEDLKAHAVDE